MGHVRTQGTEVGGNDLLERSRRISIPNIPVFSFLPTISLPRPPSLFSAFIPLCITSSALCCIANLTPSARAQTKNSRSPHYASFCTPPPAWDSHRSSPASRTSPSSPGAAPCSLPPPCSTYSRSGSGSRCRIGYRA